MEAPRNGDEHKCIVNQWDNGSSRSVRFHPSIDTVFGGTDIRDYHGACSRPAPTQDAEPESEEWVDDGSIPVKYGSNPEEEK